MKKHHHHYQKLGSLHNITSQLPLFDDMTLGHLLGTKNQTLHQHHIHIHVYYIKPLRHLMLLGTPPLELFSPCELKIFFFVTCKTILSFSSLFLFFSPSPLKSEQKSSIFMTTTKTLKKTKKKKKKKKKKKTKRKEKNKKRKKKNKKTKKQKNKKTKKQKNKKTKKQKNKKQKQKRKRKRTRKLQQSRSSREGDGEGA